MSSAAGSDRTIGWRPAPDAFASTFRTDSPLVTAKAMRQRRIHSTYGAFGRGAAFQTTDPSSSLPSS